MTRRLALLALAAALLAIRLPSLVQPMGADQGLYAYVGQRILHGDFPYRDAWDQKPPAIHYTYAALWAVWPHETVVAAADLAVAAMSALLLFALGRAIAPKGTGAAAALLFLLLSNPAFTRLGGVRLRAQCETFIGAAVAAALLLLLRKRTGSIAIFAAGLLLGIAFTYKYNAGVYTLVALAALWSTGRLTPGHAAHLGIGFCVPVTAMVLLFWAGGAFRALFDATITYNMRYSGETYAGPLSAIGYLLGFPVERARVDALWTLGGAGCVILLLAAARSRTRVLAPAWVAAACLAIAINGSRGLPQYFIQADPGLALAAAWAAALAWQAASSSIGRSAARIGATAVVLIAGIAVWRVNQFPKLVEQTRFDADRAMGRIPADEYLARYSDGRKYSPLAMAKLAEYFRAHSQPQERVYVFGFSSAAYVGADRASASRFFWSRPVIAGFNEGAPGYGVTGVANDLKTARPAVVALQRHDWWPDVEDSAPFFMSVPALAKVLEADYVRVDPNNDDYDVWIRRSATP
jgi:hypothetical protein